MTDVEPDEYPYPLDWHLQTPMQAKGGSMTAKESGLVVGTRIYDFANPIQVKAFFAELGADAVRPLDDGVHHMFWIKVPTEKDPIPFLIPQEFVPWFLLGYAAGDSVPAAQMFVGGPGVMPKHDPVLTDDDLDDDDFDDETDG